MNPQRRPANSLPGELQKYRTILVAKITAVNTPSTGPLANRPVYDWIEQSIDANGGDEDALQARQGTYTSPTKFDNVILDLNNQTLEIDQLVWARMKGVVGGNTVYETVSSAGSNRIFVVLDEVTYGSSGTPFALYSGEIVDKDISSIPVTYTRTGQTLSPIHHVEDDYVPVMRATGLADGVDGCTTGGSIGYSFTLDATTYTLKYAGGSSWTVEIDGGTGTLSVSGGTGTLTFSGTASYDAYEYSLNPWACTGDVTLTKDAGAGPATLDLTAEASISLAPLVHPLSVVRAWPERDTNGDLFYAFDRHAWIDLQRLTAESTVNGTVAPFRYKDQNTGDYVDGLSMIIAPPE